MRHTRNRQLRKINSFMSLPFTLTIEDSKNNIGDDTLDKSFKWHRVFNQVSYQEPYKGLDSYVIVRLYSNRTHRLVQF